VVGRSGSGVTLILCLVGGGLGLAAAVQWVRVASQDDRTESIQSGTLREAETGAVAALFGAMTLSAIMMPQKQQKHCCVFVQPSGNGSRFFRRSGNSQLA
jgi:hypothetical protein